MAIAFERDEQNNPFSGGLVDPDQYRPSDIGPAPSSTPDWAQVERQLREGAASRGATYDPTDLEGIQRNTGYSVGGVSLDQAMRNALANYDQRGASTNARAHDSQSAAGDALYGSGSGNPRNIPGQMGTAGGGSSSPFSNPSPQFGDPSAGLVENYALDRFRQRQNPDPGSGTALYEQYLRDYFSTLQGAPYSPTEEAQIKQTAYNAIEQERSATRQRWLEEVSRRGVLPSSGIALDGLRKIDEHYGRLRADADNAYARQAIDLTRSNRAQAASVAGALASHEEGRLSDALTYAMLPLSLQDRAFNQGLALTGAAGQVDNRSALSLLQMIQNANQLNSANRAASTQALMEYIYEVTRGR